MSSGPLMHGVNSAVMSAKKLETVTGKENLGRTGKMTYKGIEYMRNKLNSKKRRVSTRYDFYEMKNITFDFGISTPPDLKNWMSCLGWCGTAVDSLADRLVFRDFKDDIFEIDEIFKKNNKDVMLDSAILSALIASCSFVYISEDETGYPRLQVLNADSATGVIDPYTGMLREGYAVLERDEHGNPILEAWFVAGGTVYFREGKAVATYTNKAPYPLLVPIIHRADARRPFGRSKISRACMSIQGSAIRTIKRSEIAAEFYSYPQKYIAGIAKDVEMDKWKASMSSLITISKDEDGDVPHFGQFQQQTMQPHTEQLRMFASLFAGEAGLTLDDLGFATENPSSAEAIKAAHENLRLSARKAQRTFSSGFRNVAFLSACLRDDFKYDRSAFCDLEPVWHPIFEPDAAMLSSIGDGTIKINQAVPDYFNSNNLEELTGIKKGE